ncbi:MAG: glycoside hydrolase family 13 protein [Nocardioides sp.]
MNESTVRPWWRDAVCYQVYVRSFADGNGDGVGDLPGITSRLPYLAELGVDALWITPFYPSPQRDHGYDVADYLDVDPLFGRLADADELIDQAHRLGLKLIVDIVPNHTSSDHAWFREALAAAPGSPARARYLFRDGRGDKGELPPNNWLSVFGGQAWTRVTDPDGTPGQWYLHLFDSGQPDLDWRNPEVGDMFESVLRFWLDRGVDGFRIDVAHSLFKVESLRDQVRVHGDSPRPMLTEDGGVASAHEDDEPMWDQPEVHEVYRRWHRVLAGYDGDRMTVAEAWTHTPESLARYVRPDELSQSFNFAWLTAPWSATAFRTVITSTFDALAAVGASPTWVLSNHDVVRHVTRYGGGEVGVARGRAATLTMLALPGSAYLYQGEELGLEEVDVAPEFRQDPIWIREGQPGRDGCRVPLPWSGDEPPYGFSPAEPAPSAAPWIPQPASWAGLTAEAQAGDPGSTLSFYRTALRLRRQLSGDQVDLVQLGVDGGGRDVVAFRRGEVVVVLNCGDAPFPLPPGRVLIRSGRAEPTAGDPAPEYLAPNEAVWLTV